MIRKRISALWKALKTPGYRKLLTVSAAFFLHLAGVIAGFVRYRNEWSPGAAIPTPSLNPIGAYANLFTGDGLKTLLGLSLFSLLVGLILLLFREDCGHVRYDRERRFSYSTRGTYGTAGWMEEETLAECFDLIPAVHAASATEMIYGEKDGMLLCRKADAPFSGNEAVFGSSGSMKSRAYARNKIIACACKDESMIITDPKQELAADTAQYLRDKGYTVKFLNLVDPSNSDRFNGLDGAREHPIYVAHVVNAIIQNTGGPKGDHFFDAAEGQLLSALIFLRIERHGELLPTIGDAYGLLLQTESLPELEKRFLGLPADSRAKQAFNLFAKASDNLKGNVVVGLGARLSILQNPEVAALMGFPDMDFTLPGKEKCAYFIILSDQDTTMRFVTAMFFSLLFSRLVHYADNECRNGRLPVPVTLLLDEFPNVGDLRSIFIHIKISTVRSRGIRICIIFQSLGQLQNRYPDGLWSELLGNCPVQLFLGCSDPVTAQFISERSGEITLVVDTVMKQRNVFRPGMPQPSYRQSEGAGRRMLLTPDEVLRMHPERMLIILQGREIVGAAKFDYTRHPESAKFLPAPIVGATALTPTKKPVIHAEKDETDDSVSERAKKRRVKQELPGQCVMGDYERQPGGKRNAVETCIKKADSLEL